MQTLTLSCVETTFTYNSNGFRTNKTTGDVSHDYIWSDDTLLAEVTDDYIHRFIHDEAGNIIGFEHHLAELNEDGEKVYVLDATYYYEKNIFGDVIAIYDEAGDHPVAVYAYNAYGQCHVLDNYTDAAIGSLNPIRYRSYYYDADTYLYYLQSRYYDPVACRFVNPDAYVSTGQGLLGYNVFAYCRNNPVMGYDPTGYFDWEYFTISGEELKELYDDVVEEIGDLINDLRLSDGSYALHDNLRHNPDSYFHEQVMVFDPVGAENNIGYNSDNEAELFAGVGGSFTFMTGGWELGPLDISLFDIGQFTAEFGIGADEFVAELGVSLFSPSVSLDIGPCTVTVGMNFGLKLGLLNVDDGISTDLGLLSFGISV